MEHNYYDLDGGNNTLASVYIPPSCWNNILGEWDSTGLALIRYVRYEAKNNPVDYKNKDVRWTNKSWFERMQNKEHIGKPRTHLKTKLSLDGRPLPRLRSDRRDKK